MRGSTRPTIELEERGDGVRVFVGALQRLGGHDPEGPGKVDGGNMGRSIPLR